MSRSRLHCTLQENPSSSESLYIQTDDFVCQPGDTGDFFQVQRIGFSRILRKSTRVGIPPSGVRHRAIGEMKVLIVMAPKFDPEDEGVD